MRDTAPTGVVCYVQNIPTCVHSCRVVKNGDTSGACVRLLLYKRNAPDLDKVAIMIIVLNIVLVIAAVAIIGMGALKATHKQRFLFLTVR